MKRFGKMSNGDLVRHLQHNRDDEDGWREFNRRFQGKVSRVAGGYDRNELEDTVQEVMHRIYTTIDQLREPEAIDHWVGRIAINHIRDKHRKRKPDVASLDEPVGEEGVLLGDTLADPHQESVEEHVLRKERQETIQKAMLSLPDRQRIALTYYAMEGLSYVEIAAVMGANIETIKAWIHRARKVIRDKLEQYDSNAAC